MVNMSPKMERQKIARKKHLASHEYHQSIEVKCTYPLYAKHKHTRILNVYELYVFNKITFCWCIVCVQHINKLRLDVKLFANSTCIRIISFHTSASTYLILDIFMDLINYLSIIATGFVFNCSFSKSP